MAGRGDLNPTAFPMLIFVLCCGALPIVGGLVLLALNMRDSNPFKSNPTALTFAIGASIIPPVLLLIADFIMMVNRFNGECVGPPDYNAPCSFVEYLAYNYFNSIGVFGYAALCIASLGWASLIFGFTALYFRKYKNS